MPNHFHALLTPGAGTTLEKAMMMIKGGSAHKLRQENLYRWPVWQSGFHDHWIRDQREYRMRLDYIGSNPVKARLTERAAEYLLSSFSGKFDMDPSGFDVA